LLVQDELASTVGKVDRAKQLLHFPAVDGFRFRSGSGGIFLGSKDLFISELAASFYLACSREIAADGRPKARAAVPPDSKHHQHALLALRCDRHGIASPRQAQEQHWH
jgi:hypothetical protein